MKLRFALVFSLPILAISCSDDSDDDGFAGSAGTAGTGAGTAGAAGTAGTGGSSGGTAGAGGSAAGSAGSAGASGSAGTSGAAGAAGSGGGEDEPDAGGADSGSGADGDALDDGTMTFFVTSDGLGDGGNLGGLDGADAFCTELAVAASPDFARRTWHAYLSTTEEDARDRIGTGPWRNQAGVIIANDLTQLHDQGDDGALNDTWPIADLTIALDEQGDQVPNNVHDVLTGTQADGTLDPDLTCE